MRILRASGWQEKTFEVLPSISAVHASSLALPRRSVKIGVEFVVSFDWYKKEGQKKRSVLTSSKQIPETTRYNMIIARIMRTLFPFNVSPPYRQHNISGEIVQIICENFSHV
jgi:hypothetical protein